MFEDLSAPAQPSTTEPHRALYLRWRPKRFEDVVGQQHVTQTLRNAVRLSRPAHAYLFTGPRGTGKTTVAEATAIISIADVLITNDTGPAHIGAALHTPTLVIFGPTNPLTTRRDRACPDSTRQSCA